MGIIADVVDGSSRTDDDANAGLGAGEDNKKSGKVSSSTMITESSATGLCTAFFLPLSLRGGVLVITILGE
jgi:hypothetical protein